MTKMKKLDRKGFTLIELLAVLVILVVIMSIAIPNITSSVERSKNKQKESKIKLLESAAEIYIDRIENTIEPATCVGVDTLKNEGLITEEQAKDPFNNSDIKGCYSYYEGKWIEE